MPESVSVAREALVVGHLRLGLSIVGEFLWDDPFRMPELISDMTEAVVHGVELMEQGAIDHHNPVNVGGYLATTIRGALKKTIFREKRQRYRYRTGGERRTKVKREYQQMTIDELEQILESAIKSPNERKVIESRLEGLSDYEIAEKLNMTASGVNYLRMNVRKRFLERLSNGTQYGDYGQAIVERYGKRQGGAGHRGTGSSHDAGRVARGIPAHAGESAG